MPSRLNVKCIHIGCHRCGSTFIQKRVLTRLTRITPLTYDINHGILKELTYLVLCGDLYYDAGKIRGPIRERLAGLDNIVVSLDSFSGLDEGLGPGYQMSYVPGRLHDIFGETGILVIVRNQESCLSSFYRSIVRKGCLASFKVWIRNQHKDHHLDFLKYSRLIQAYADVFGKANVEVVLFEELFRRETFERMLSRFGIETAGLDAVDLDRRENESLTGPTLTMTRFVHHMTGSKLTHRVNVGEEPSLRAYNWWRYRIAPRLNSLCVRMGFSSTSFEFDGYREFLRDLYHEDNRRLSEWIGRDLAPYGYV